VINLLISHGGDVQVTNQKGQTPISWCNDNILKELNLLDIISTSKTSGTRL